MQQFRYLQCVKGIADSENINILCLKGDVIKVIDIEEVITADVIVGWMQGLELTFTPQQIVDHFEYYNSSI